MEKHFPAPDRQKLFSLLGIDLSAKKTPSPAEKVVEQKGKKRKGRGNLTLSPEPCSPIFNFGLILLLLFFYFWFHLDSNDVKLYVM